MEFLISRSKQSNFTPITTIHNANSTEIPERKSKVNGGVLVEKYKKICIQHLTDGKSSRALSISIHSRKNVIISFEHKSDERQ